MDDTAPRYPRRYRKFVVTRLTRADGDGWRRDAPAHLPSHRPYSSTRPPTAVRLSSARFCIPRCRYSPHGFVFSPSPPIALSSPICSSRPTSCWAFCSQWPAFIIARGNLTQTIKKTDSSRRPYCAELARCYKRPPPCSGQ